MYVTPDQAHNPIVPPERFIGYHVGLDYEIFASERNKEVPVFAVCSGTILYSGFAQGYGGLIVQRCMLNNEHVTVLYGHLDHEGLPREDTVVNPGQRIGKLAAARSQWSDGNRKHLHLGIHRGDTLDVRGYVQHADELKEFLDPREVLPRGKTGRRVDKFKVIETPPEGTKSS